MQYRLNNSDKEKVVAMYKTDNYTCKQLGEIFNISGVAIGGLLKRRCVKLKPQTELQRKYSLNEDYFDNIDSEDKAYFLGILYADGYNNTDRFSVNLSLQARDVDILNKLSKYIETDKPFQKIEFKNDNHSTQYRMVIANKKISSRLSELGCIKKKTFFIEYPILMPSTLDRHFVRGYFDGDGYIGKVAATLVGTECFCKAISKILKKEIGINTSLSTRHPDRNHNIRSLGINGRKQMLKFIDWMYKDSTVYLDRKYKKYIAHVELDKKMSQPKNRLCSIDGCNQKYSSRGYCKNHVYELRGGKEKRHDRYKKTGK